MILDNLHFYLSLSFVIMLAIIAWLAYKKGNIIIQSKIDALKKSIDDSITKKLDLEEAITNKVSDINSNKREYSLILNRAQERAEQINIEYNLKIKHIVEEKERDYQETINKIEDSLTVKLQKEVVDLIYKETEQKIKKNGSLSSFKNASFQRSIEMLKNI